MFYHAAVRVHASCLHLRDRLAQCLRAQEGYTMMEYLILGVALSAVLVAAASSLGTTVSTLFSSKTTKLQTQFGQ